MKLLAVNFHYIREPGSDPFPAVFPVPARQLEAQLLELGRYFSFVSGEQVLEASELGKPLPRHACLITFDDGLRCQYENALPILDRLAVPALFFVCGRPLTDGTALHVHRIQFVRSRLAPRVLAAELESLVQGDGASATDLAHCAEVARQTYRYDTPEDALVKWQLNFGLGPAQAEGFVGRLFRQIVRDEAAWCEETYMSRGQVRELAQRQSLGNHSFDHLPLSRLRDDEMRWQLLRNQRLLEALGGGAAVRFVSYPYGGENAVGRREADWCHQIGARIGFTMERCFNATLGDPLLLARVDTNDAPGGRRPLLSFAEGRPESGGALPGGRSRHLSEVPGSWEANGPRAG